MRLYLLIRTSISEHSSLEERMYEESLFSAWSIWDANTRSLVASAVFFFRFFCRYFSKALFRISSFSCSDQLLLLPAMRKQPSVMSCCMLCRRSFNKVVKRIIALSTALFDNEKHKTSSDSISKLGNSFFLFWNHFSQRDFVVKTL